MNDIHLEKKIYYHDTDAGGVVYYASYLKHLEEARTEYFRAIGIDIAGYARQGVIFPVVHLEVDYKSPARYADTVKIFTKVEKMGNCSIDIMQEIKKGDVVLVKARTVWACVSAQMKPRRIPDDMRKTVEGEING
ncbi:MAG: YbgC/FadM family acyl-CoA thioesterase [Candidatus Omnitrophica bacterium]|nr:YbgC/FadM family acyl-CoA thioesterase [Candidatus Omnitrophota bacterium]